MLRNLPIFAFLALLATTPARAQGDAAADFPSRPVRLIVPVAPGGTQDTIARAISSRLPTLWGQQVVVDNRQGAGGSIGMELVAKSVSDGHTIVSAQNGILCIAPHTGKLSYDPVRDFAAVTQTAVAPNVIVVHPSLPVKNVKEFVVFAKARPGVLTYGTAGNGSLGHLAGSLLGQVAGIDLLHIPYKGGGQAVIDVVSGQVSSIILGLAGPIPHIRSGRLRAIAVTSTKRAAALPDTPTIAESGFPGFDASSWFALLVPVGTPPKVVAKLNKGIVGVLKQPEVQKILAIAGFEVTGSSPEFAQELIKRELAQWGRVIKTTGMKFD